MNVYRNVLTQQTTLELAVEELTHAIDVKKPPTLVCFFASTHFRDRLPLFATRLGEHLGTLNVMGCLADVVVADEREVEGEPCISMWAAWWPNATVELQHARFERPDASFSSLPSDTKLIGSSVLMLADPYSFPADVLLERWNQELPGMPVSGCLSSESAVVAGRDVFDEGAVVAAIQGVPVTSFVSQGCRPIGEPLVITKAEQNVLFELGGKSANEQLQSIYDRLPTRDKDLMRRGIHLGRVVNEYQDAFEPGDFLIRNVTGFEPEDGSISVGEYYRVGQTVQFHLRDAESASTDLNVQLLRYARRSAFKSALLFNCTGRGTRMFEHPDHDAQAIHQALEGVPCAGCSCNGEIGPVGNQNFVHGFTASVVLFE